MEYALIGCGRVAPSHLKAAEENGFHLAAVCDIDNGHIDRLFEQSRLPAEQTAAVRRFADYREMLRTVRPTLVSIALPSGLHAECAKAAILCGCSVIVEKPIALSLRDADELVLLAKKTGVKVSACHQNRFNPAVQQMRAYLEQGCFGTLSNAAVTVRWSRDEGYYANDNWRGTWKMDGGALMNQSIHGIDLLRWMCGGELKRVYGAVRNRQHPYIETEDVGTAVLEFANGCIATLEGGVNVCGPDLEEHLTLIGSAGVMKLGGINASTVDYCCFAHEGEAKENVLREAVSGVYGNGHTALFADVADAIEKNREPYVTALDGRNALETVLAVYRSARTGQPVELPLTDACTEEMNDYFSV